MFVQREGRLFCECDLVLKRKEIFWIFLFFCQDRLLTFPLQPLLFSSPDEPQTPLRVLFSSPLEAFSNSASFLFSDLILGSVWGSVSTCIFYSFTLLPTFHPSWRTAFFNLFSDSRVPRQDKWSKASMNESRQILEERIFTLFVLELASAWMHWYSLTVYLLFSYASLLPHLISVRKVTKS